MLHTTTKQPHICGGLAILSSGGSLSFGQMHEIAYTERLISISCLPPVLSMSAEQGDAIMCFFRGLALEATKANYKPTPDRRSHKPPQRQSSKASRQNKYLCQRFHGRTQGHSRSFPIRRFIKGLGHSTAQSEPQYQLQKKTVYKTADSFLSPFFVNLFKNPQLESHCLFSFTYFIQASKVICALCMST